MREYNDSLKQYLKKLLKNVDYIKDVSEETLEEVLNLF